MHEYRCTPGRRLTQPQMPRAGATSKRLPTSFAKRRSARPGDWFNKNLLSAGRGWAPDEVLHDAVATDDDTLNAYVELLTGPHALKLRQCMAAWFGSQLAQDIFLEHMESLQ